LSCFIGQSKAIRRLHEKLKTIALSNYTVLVRGESGTGKELAAHAIHDLSNRRNKKLIIVNCPAVPEHLLESELFGHEKGAFTGADQKQVGLFAEADGGTICLDEIGDIPVAVQTKLLRVLQEQEIKPLGSVKTRKIDVRIIAVTNQDLEEKIARKEFREDLFHRLNIVNIRLPSLITLKQDIPIMVSHFTRKICRELNLDERQFSPGAVKLLQERPWPGNVRELQNTLRQIIIFSTETMITEDEIDFPETVEQQHIHKSLDLFQEDELQPYKTAKDRLVHQFTDQYISSLLEKSAGNVTRAAQISGLTRTALHRIIRRIKEEKCEDH
jgi:DNA-binding NtrC family response regulator